MSRLKKFTRSLLAGYLQLGANIFFTLASVPLALHYLDKAEFGLWAVVSQLSAYMLLLDFGMNGAVSRILIDHKDDRANGIYGGIFKIGALVGVVQGGIVVLAGVALSFVAGSLLHVPTELRREFVGLMAGQSALLGINFGARIFSLVLMAHQRMDVNSYSAAGLFFLNLIVMWIGYASGLGVYSLLAGQAASNLVGLIVSVIACSRLGLIPRSGEWGTISFARFRELFAYSTDIFLYALGIQLINASQAILLTRLLGLETTAIWNVCTRTYAVLTQLICRIFDYSAPALAEMMVRDERELLKRRFHQLQVFSLSAAVAIGSVFALCNSAFVTLWTHGRISWPHINDFLLAIWLVVSVNMRLHTGLVGQTKKLHFMRFLFFIEGAIFVSLTIAFYRLGGMTSMLINSILCTSTLSQLYGMYRTREYFGLTWSEFFSWLKPTLRLTCWLLPMTLIVWWLGRALPTPWQFALNFTVPSLWAILMFLRHGLEPSFHAEMIGKLPAPLQSLMRRVAA